MINIEKMASFAEHILEEPFKKIDKIRYSNQIKVLDALRKNKLSDTDFNYTTGYGYGDKGREKIEKVFAEIFKTQDALVRHQIVSGTQAISIALFANLRPGEALLSIYGEPYETLLKVIGTNGSQKGSLLEMGIKYDFVPVEDHAEQLVKKMKCKPKVCLIQRSKGYSKRKSLSVNEIGRLIKIIKRESSDSIVIVDNCYGEFVELIEPSEIGADLTVGSLIKNPGGGLAPCGEYIAGTSDLIENCEYRMTCPGIGREVGPSLGFTRDIVMGIFFAPHIVSESLKSALFCCVLARELGYTVYPYDIIDRTDIVQAIEFNDEKLMIKFCQGIQKYSPVDSFVRPEPWDMPGYEDKVIMAAGTFTQGSSIELSCDGPLRTPYIAYFQGGLFFDHAKYAITNTFKDLKKEV